MKRIAYYISDHGYGHASRSIAVIRRLLETLLDIEIYVNSSYPLKFLRESLSDKNGVKFRRVRNDFGYVSDENIEINAKKIENRYKNWQKTWESYIYNEKEFCKSKDIDLILSDIAPQPFIVGDELGIPSIGISNFTWYEIYEELFDETKKIEKLKKAYKKADLGLILPFETGLDPFEKKEKVGLICRENTKDYQIIRDEMGTNDEEKIIYFGVGKSYFDNGKNNFQFLDALRENYSIMVSSGYDLIDDPDYVIPEDETESQNYIGACDLIISKFGYGVVSEGITSRTPMILAKRNILEDEKGMEKLKRWEMIDEVSRECLISGEYLEKVHQMFYEENNFYQDVSERLRQDGSKEVIRIVDEFLN